jgi:hypothetical protein
VVASMVVVMGVGRRCRWRRWREDAKDRAVS